MSNVIKFLEYLNVEGVISVVLLVSIFVDISPIKLNPIKAIMNYIGKCFNASIVKTFQQEINSFKQEVNEKFEIIQSEQIAQRETLDKLVIDQENKEISRLRWEIINFENSLINGDKHSREQYRHIIDSGNKYDRMILTNNIEDDENLPKVREAIDHIKSHYESKRLDQTALLF